VPHILLLENNSPGLSVGDSQCLAVGWIRNRPAAGKHDNPTAPRSDGNCFCGCFVSTAAQKATGQQSDEYDSDNYAMCFHNDFGVMWNMA
jgi:hypothetical protein